VWVEDGQELSILILVQGMTAPVDEDTYSGVNFCHVVSDGRQTCSSASFSTDGISYQWVCGRVRGYQKGRSAAFYGGSRTTIDGPYIEGLSIAYGNPHQHIWTYHEPR